MEPPSAAGSPAQRSAATVSIDLNRTTVSRVRQRWSGPDAGLVDAARDAQITLTKAVALRARMAESLDDLEAAQHLVHRRYAWRGYDVTDRAEADGIEVDAQPENRIVFVAKDAHATVGTITLGLDHEQGLLAEDSYPEVVRAKREAGCKVCEVTRLAVAENAESKPVLAALFSLAFATASRHGVTDVFVEVNPRHVVFYRRVLGFVVAAGEKFCERVKAPSVLLWLTMDDLERRLVQLNERVSAVSYGDARAA